VNPWAEVLVDGRSLGQTPIEPQSLPPGKHSVVLKNSQLHVEKRMEVTVKSSADTVVKVDLLE
jgi:serine/threonine-protein kinase